MLRKQTFAERIQEISTKYFGKDILEILAHSKNYFLGDVVGQTLLFLTIPIFTRLLSPADYGTFQVFRSYATIFLMVLTLNFHGTVARYYYDNRDDYKEFVGTSMLGSFVSLTLSVIVLFLFRQPLSTVFGISQGVLVLILVFLPIRVLDTVFNQISISRKDSSRYALVNNIRSVLAYGGGIALIYFFQKDKFYGPILGQLLAGVLISFYTIKIIKAQLKWAPSFQHVKYIFNYSVPLIPYALSGLLLDQLDRIIVNKTLGASDAGLYSFAYNIGMVVSLSTDALSNALVPDWFRLMKNHEYGRINLLMEKIFNLTLCIAFAAILFSKELVELLSDKQYHVALSILPIVIVGYVFDALSKVYLRSIGYTNKVIYVSIVGLITVAFNFILNIIFLPRYGYVAGAYVTVASFFVLFVLAWWVAKFILKQPTTPLRIFWYPSLAFAAAIGIHITILRSDVNLFPSIFLRVVLFFAFVSILLVINRQKFPKQSTSID